MPQNVTMYDVLISCPGDIQEELSVINEVIEQFNQQYMSVLGIGIRTRHWSKSSYTQSGNKPQALLNTQFVNDCDAAIAIFATRFGTKTDKYGSGSEEEIELMLQSGKQVFMYFSDKPVNPSEIDMEQYKKVKDFKEKYGQRGIYYTYTSIDDFRNKLNAHIAQHFLTQSRVEEYEKSTRPELVLKSIKKNSLSDDMEYMPFDFGGYPSVVERRDNIIAKYQEIIDSPVQSDKSINAKGGLALSFNQKIEISDENRKILSKIAEYFNIDLPEGFFTLGALAENSMVASMNRLYGSRELIGSDEEKKKYRAIVQLQKLIDDFFAWAKINECYCNFQGIGFVLDNVGNSYDEDIDILLHLPKGVLLHHSQFDYPGDDCFERLLDHECTLESLFCIAGTDIYSSYEASCKPVSFVKTPASIGNPLFSGRDYYQEYREDLDDIFAYEVFEKEDEDIVKLHVDYIKQHSRVAFPTLIFVKNLEPFDVQYSIISKCNPNVIDRTISFCNK